ncbi:MAG: type II secretion system minor pseudopilin GspH [Gammaproteobacteria bacterium]|nr:type II secretion system minor pseudopilin GspH [Gammaproteobacteria bacterium]
MKRRKTLGFTLIEILIVLVIVSIVAGTAVLGLQTNVKKHLESYATEFAQQLSFVREQAILLTQVLGVTFEQQRLIHLTLEAELKKKPSWKLVDALVFKSQPLPKDIEVLIKTPAFGETPEKNEDDDKETLKPALVFSTNGDMTPFTIFIGKRGQKPHVAIVGSSDGYIENKILE